MHTTKPHAIVFEREKRRPEQVDLLWWDAFATVLDFDDQEIPFESMPDGERCIWHAFHRFERIFHHIEKRLFERFVLRFESKVFVCEL